MTHKLLFGITGSLFLFLVFFSSCGGRREKQEDTSENIVALGEEETSKTVKPLDFKLYMERSGSMVSFDSGNSKGDFKGIISTLLNRFPKVNSNDSTSVYIVNDNIYPYEGTVKDFLGQRDFFSSTKDIGNASYTDFNLIFEMILADTKKYQVSALVTDMIYSVKGQEEVVASKLLNEAYALTHNVFKGKTSTSVIVLKFMADYNGFYYPYNSPAKGIDYSGERPFYVMLFASRDTMEELYNCQEYASFVNFSTLGSYENMFCFTGLTFDPSYSIIPDYPHDGRYHKSREKHQKGIHGVKDVQLSKDDELSIPVAVDLSSIPMAGNYKKNKDYYKVVSEAGFKVSSIQTIDDIENREIVLKDFPAATHLIMLSTESKPKNETVTIQLEYRLPEWISKSSTDDDSNLNGDNFSSTTFGFKEVMKGIFNAYVPDGKSRNLFVIKIDIKK